MGRLGVARSGLRRLELCRAIAAATRKVRALPPCQRITPRTAMNREYPLNNTSNPAMTALVIAIC
jgi:hypothetical protein